MPDSITLAILDPKTDIHIGELVYLHITVQNIDTDTIILKELQFRPDAGIHYENPNVREGGEHETIGEVTNSFFFQPCTVYSKIIFDKENKLEAGNQISRTFPFRAGGLLRKNIDAGKYNIVFTVKYEKGGKEYTKVETKEITVYYNLLYMIAGGIIGGFLGVMYRDWEIIFGMGWATAVSNILFGVFVGFMIVVILNRRSNVQSFISINDFWGALLAGFVAGVLGKELISGYLTGIGPAATNTTANLTGNATLAAIVPS